MKLGLESTERDGLTLRSEQIVFALWSVFSVALIVAVAVFGVDLPKADDFEYVAQLVGEPVTFAWLIEPHNEHRILVPRLIWLGLDAVFGANFTVAMFLNAVAMSAAVLTLLLAARRRFGALTVTDAIIPLTFLGFNHWENITWAHQVQFVGGSVLACILMAVGLNNFDGRRRWVTATICLLLLPWFGAQSVLITFPLALWCLLHSYRLNGSARTALLVSSIISLVSVAGLVLSHRPSAGHESLKAKSLFIAIKYTLAELALSIALHSELAVLIGLVLLAVSTVVAVLALRTGAAFESSDILIAGLAGTIALGFVTAAARAGNGSLVPADRYATLMAPGLIAAYLLARTLSAAGLASARVFAVLAVAFAGMNIQEGIEKFRKRSNVDRKIFNFLAAVSHPSEVPAPIIAQMHPSDTHARRILGLLISARESFASQDKPIPPFTYRKWNEEEYCLVLEDSAADGFSGTDFARTVRDGLAVRGSFITDDAETGHVDVRVNRGQRILYRTGPVVSRQKITIIGASGFASKAPQAKDWLVLDFSIASLPETFVVRFSDDGRGWGEWSAIGLSTPGADCEAALP
ncbi:MAG: hypothetical protein AAF662_07335 [Pseudomonadota bacterium]